MHIDLSQHWDLFGREGDMRPGHEYHCPKVGAIDLLAKHKSENKWLVIEMKRDYSSDKVVGQVLRYMGWVKQNLAKDGEVHGLIIGLFPDVKLEHALIPVPNLEFRRYKVSFSLEESVT
jgi:RecB family endonuclease NucS